MASHSKARNESLMLRYLSEIISYKVKNPSLGLATITSVSITKDYSYATVFVSFLGDGDPLKKVAILDEAKGFIRFELSQKLQIRKMPDLRFVYDDTLDKAARLDALLKKVNKDE